ncbi:MAG: PaaI family thioesterase [Actinomycetota bacterium]
MSELPAGAPAGSHVIPDSYSPPFHKTLRVCMAIGPNGEGVAWLDVDPERHYGARWAHGGVVPALVDIASGIAIARTLADAAKAIDGTIDLKVNFLRKVIDGDITAVARLLRAGKRVAFTEVEVTNKGTRVAMALATFMLNRDR